MSDDQDDFDAACFAQLELEERRKREDDEIARLRPIGEQFSRDLAEWERTSPLRYPFRRQAI